MDNIGIKDDTSSSFLWRASGECQRGDCAGCEGGSPVRVARDHSVEEEEGRS